MKHLLPYRITAIMLMLFGISLFLNQVSYGQTVETESSQAGWNEALPPYSSNAWSDASGGGATGRNPGTTSFRARYITVANAGITPGAYNLTVRWFDSHTDVASEIFLQIGQRTCVPTSTTVCHTGSLDMDDQWLLDIPINTFATRSYPGLILSATDTIFYYIKLNGGSPRGWIDYLQFTPAGNPNAPTIANQTFSTSECSTIGTAVGTVVASDVDNGQILSYSITGGNGAGKFAINSSTGAITVNGTLDFETTASYPLTVQVDDDGVPSKNSSATVTINILDCTNENPPTVNNQTFSINENTAIGTPFGPVVASDLEGNTLTYSILPAGNIGLAFAINPSTGALIVNNSINFEALSSYSLTVQVTDNGTPVRSSTATITINVNDVNENPNTPSIANQTFSVNENTIVGTVIDTVVATDGDLGQVLTYSITAGNTGNVFIINSSTGAISVNGVLDYEVTTSYALTVQATDNGQPNNSATATVTININDVADPNLNNPVIADQTFSVDENSTPGIPVGTVAASDVEWWQTLTFSVIAGDPGGLFSVTSAGVITVDDYYLLDFETTPSYALTIVVYDNATDTVRTDTATVTINLNDLDESGLFPFIERKVWSGPFDIKMIAAPNLQPVFIDPDNAVLSELKADSLITSEIMQRTGNLISINNRYKDGTTSPNSPFVLAGDSDSEVEDFIPMTAFCGGDPNTTACTQGLISATPTGTCPVRYTGVNTVSRFISMTYADYDADNTTYSSSMANLNISSCAPVEIEAAYLYWTGMFQGGNDNLTLVNGLNGLNSYSGLPSGTVFNTSTTSGHNTVLLKVPGGSYQQVTATAGNTRNDNERYVCVADVTGMMQGGIGAGDFWVANLQSYPIEGNGGSASGWTLIVILRSPTNPPRFISLWDGLICTNDNDPQPDCPSSTTITLTGLTTPPTTNFNSYVGLGVLDGENLATELDNSDPREGLGFQTDSGGVYVDVNPFVNNGVATTHKLYTIEGYPADCNGDKIIDACGIPLAANSCDVYDGISSSHITTYTDASGKNGNEMTRLPSNVNTLGFDVHHMKLPSNAVAGNATTATLTIQGGPQGGTNPFLAYIALETVQPQLELTKTSDSSTVTIGTPYSYFLTAENVGNDASLDSTTNIIDRLPVEVDYISHVVTKYVGGIPSNITSTGRVKFANINDSISFIIMDSTEVGDSVVIEVKVKVISDSLQLACKRDITNTAFLTYYLTSTDSITVESNSSSCNAGNQSVIDIFPRVGGELFTLSSVDVCESAGTDVRTQIETDLFAYDPTLEAVKNLIQITDTYFQVVPLGTVFPELNGTVNYFAILPGNCDKIYALTYECDAEVFIPNLITPGKDGRNDEFKILGLNPDTEVKIFNRWGKLVYHSNNYTNDWKPEDESEGIYYYHIDDPKREKQWKGWVHVINELK